MDQSQYSLIVRAIAVSANPLLASVSDRNDASSLLDQFASSDLASTASTQLLSMDVHQFGPSNVTAVVKLFSLLVLKKYVEKSYAGLGDVERADFRNAIMSVVARLSSSEQNDMLIAPKLSSLLADIVLNDFPQRWESFFDDVLRVRFYARPHLPLFSVCAPLTFTLINFSSLPSVMPPPKL